MGEGLLRRIDQEQEGRGPARRVVWVWGLPLAPLTSAELLDAIDRLVEAGEPSYIVTANLNYAMLSERHPDLAAVNRDAAFVVADGMPLVWAARKQGTSLPERIAGSDLIFRLSERAAARKYRVYFLGGNPGVAEIAAERLAGLYPGLQVVGTEAPMFSQLSELETAQLMSRIHAARPDILVAAAGQPKGERWVHANHREAGVPVCIQLGASIDFAAGRIRRAPRWMQRTGLEWLFRLALEPRRLGGRYFGNAVFLARHLLPGRSDPAPRGDEA